MLSDEEKKAIDYLQLCYDLSTITNESLSKLGIVLNLIEKQSKEIEELKKYEEGYKLLSYSLDNYISNDKIKAKIEYYEKIDNPVGKRVLQSLLEKE